MKHATVLLFGAALFLAATTPVVSSQEARATIISEVVFIAAQREIYYFYLSKFIKL